MASRIEISAQFPTTNSQREIHRYIAGIDPAATLFEQAIEEVTGQKVTVHIRSVVVRGEKTDKAGAPVELHAGNGADAVAA